MNHFLDIAELGRDTLNTLLDSADALKKERLLGQRRSVLSGKMIGLLFEKPSTRTRVSFEVGISELGGDRLVLKGEDVGLGKREPLEDVMRVFDRYLDALVVRTFSHEILQSFRFHAHIPIINALSDHSHPCQGLADVMTIREHFGHVKDLKICYLGDGNNVCRSLVECAQLLDIPITVSSPPGFQLEGLEGVSHISDPEEAVKDAAVVYTDTWVSMGEEDQQKSLDVFLPYQVNADLMGKARRDAIFLHCLPAHRGQEVTHDVIESSQSKVFDQAENRLHAQKAVLNWLFRS